MGARIVRLFIMDENTSPPPEAADLSRQYQEILNKYAKELVKSEAPEPPPPLPVDPIVSDPPPVLIPTPEVITGQSITASPPRNVFKYIFFLSLLVFMGVSSALVYTLFNSPATPPPTSLPSPQPILEPGPTISSAVCELNDQRYLVGDSFPAADNCNTCICQPDLTISCTEKTCDGVSPTAGSKRSLLTPSEALQIFPYCLLVSNFQIMPNRLI